MPDEERKRSNNDSPIVISDTTGILSGAPKPKSTATHGKGFGKNANNRFTVHDKSGNKDDYRPACLEFPSGKVKIPADAESFLITYTASDGTSGTLLSWSENADAYVKAGDITFGQGWVKSGNDITLAVKVVSMDWSIDGGSSTQVDVNGALALVTIHYCPGGKCTDANGNDLCG